MNTQDNTAPEARPYNKGKWIVEGAGWRVSTLDGKFVADCGHQQDALFIARAPALTQEVAELRKENERLRKALKGIYGMAEDGYAQHKRNGSHQEFLSEDRDALWEAAICIESALSGTKETE